MTRPRIAAVCGSLRTESATRVALTRALDAAESRGARTDLIDLRELDVPVYDGDRGDAGDAAELRGRVRAADGLLLGTPVYHGSYSSPLKAALDYCRFEGFEGKPVGLVAVAGGRFPTPALLHLQTVCSWLRAHPLPRTVGIPDAGDAIDGDAVGDEDYATRLDRLGRSVVDHALGEPADPLELASGSA